jgi:hypothetical protein
MVEHHGPLRTTNRNTRVMSHSGRMTPGTYMAAEGTVLAGRVSLNGLPSPLTPLHAAYIYHGLLQCLGHQVILYP